MRAFKRSTICLLIVLLLVACALFFIACKKSELPPLEEAKKPTQIVADGPAPSSQEGAQSGENQEGGSTSQEGPEGDPSQNDATHAGAGTGSDETQSGADNHSSQDQGEDASGNSGDGASQGNDTTQGNESPQGNESTQGDPSGQGGGSAANENPEGTGSGSDTPDPVDPTSGNEIPEQTGGDPAEQTNPTGDDTGGEDPTGGSGEEIFENDPIDYSAYFDLSQMREGHHLRIAFEDGYGGWQDVFGEGTQKIGIAKITGGTIVFCFGEEQTAVRGTLWGDWDEKGVITDYAYIEELQSFKPIRLRRELNTVQIFFTESEWDLLTGTDDPQIDPNEGAGEDITDPEAGQPTEPSQGDQEGQTTDPVQGGEQDKPTEGGDGQGEEETDPTEPPAADPSEEQNGQGEGSGTVENPIGDPQSGDPESGEPQEGGKPQEGGEVQTPIEEPVTPEEGAPQKGVCPECNAALSSDSAHEATCSKYADLPAESRVFDLLNGIKGMREKRNNRLIINDQGEEYFLTFNYLDSDEYDEFLLWLNRQKVTYRERKGSEEIYHITAEVEDMGFTLSFNNVVGDDGCTIHLRVYGVLKEEPEEGAADDPIQEESGSQETGEGEMEQTADPTDSSPESDATESTESGETDPIHTETPTSDPAEQFGDDTGDPEKHTEDNASEELGAPEEDASGSQEPTEEAGEGQDPSQATPPVQGDPSVAEQGAEEGMDGQESLEDPQSVDDSEGAQSGSEEETINETPAEEVEGGDLAQENENPASDDENPTQEENEPESGSDDTAQEGGGAIGDSDEQGSAPSENAGDDPAEENGKDQEENGNPSEESGTNPEEHPEEEKEEPEQVVIEPQTKPSLCPECGAELAAGGSHLTDCARYAALPTNSAAYPWLSAFRGVWEKVPNTSAANFVISEDLENYSLVLLTDQEGFEDLVERLEEIKTAKTVFPTKIEYRARLHVDQKVYSFVVHIEIGEQIYRAQINWYYSFD